MNTAAKGRRNEHRSRACLERLGYEVVRSAASKGTWDLIGLRNDGIVLVQVKSGRPAGPAERSEMAQALRPANALVIQHVWRDHVREPEVLVLTGDQWVSNQAETDAEVV